MTLLKVVSSRPGYRLVGASLPLLIHNYITLYTLAKGMSKTKIFKNLLDDWISSQKERGETEEELISKIIYRANAQWRVEKARRRSGKPFSQFIKELEDELYYKGLSEVYVKAVINGVNR